MSNMEKIKTIWKNLETLLGISCSAKKDLMCWCRLPSKTPLPDLRVIIVLPQPVMRLTNRQTDLYPCADAAVGPAMPLNMHGVSSKSDAQSTCIAKSCTALDHDTLQAALRYPTYADLRLFCATPAQALTCEPEGHRLSLSITLSAEN